MISDEGCAECKRLSLEYEAATMEWFRVQGQLRIAEYSRAEDVSQKITVDLERISKRRERLREAISRHESEAHPRSAAGSP